MGSANKKIQLLFHALENKVEEYDEIQLFGLLLSLIKNSTVYLNPTSTAEEHLNYIATIKRMLITARDNYLLFYEDQPYDHCKTALGDILEMAIFWDCCNALENMLAKMKSHDYKNIRPNIRGTIHRYKEKSLNNK